MMSRIKDAETAQMVAEMKQRIAQLEIEVQFANLMFFIFLNSFLWTHIWIAFVQHKIITRINFYVSGLFAYVLFTFKWLIHIFA